jgi:NagD protein
LSERSVLTAVFDIDGTLALMNKETGRYEALPGAVAALAACRTRSRPAIAYTNGTFFPPEHYYQRLASAGLDFDHGHILTPAVVAAHELHRAGCRRVMLLGAEGTRLPIEARGIETVPPTEAGHRIDAVMLSWSRNFDARDLEAICAAVWAGVPVYASSDAPYFAGAKGKILGISGAVAAMVEHATGVKPTILGKPALFGLQMIASMTGVPASQMIVIGDDPTLEIRMARQAGALAVGVTTGLADEAAFRSGPQEMRADIVLPSLERLVDQSWFA